MPSRQGESAACNVAHTTVCLVISLPIMLHGSRVCLFISLPLEQLMGLPCYQPLPISSAAITKKHSQPRSNLLGPLPGREPGAAQPRAEATVINKPTEPKPRLRLSRPPQPQVAPSTSKTESQAHAEQGTGSGGTQPDFSPAARKPQPSSTQAVPKRRQGEREPHTLSTGP